MTQEQIEGNKIIAEFMGVPLKSKQITFSNPEIEIEKDRTFKYHSSWDWLMPAVNKFIESAEPTDSWDNYKHKEYCDRLKKLVANFSITLVFNLLSEAIKRYNQNKQK